MTMPTLNAIRALNGCNFAMLSDEERAVLRFYRDQGRKFDVAITITSDADSKELERVSRDITDPGTDDRIRSALREADQKGQLQYWAEEIGITGGLGELRKIMNSHDALPPGDREVLGLYLL